MLTSVRHLRFAALLGAAATLSGCKPSEDPLPTKSELLEERAELDEKVWGDEVTAQEYEQVFVDLWDSLRRSKDKLGALGAVSFESLVLPEAGYRVAHELGIVARDFVPSEGEPLSPDAWRGLLDRYRNEGYQIFQSDWHHNRFEPGSPPKSVVGFTIHVLQTRTQKAVTLEGELRVHWQRGEDPVAGAIEVTQLRTLTREGGGHFRRVLVAEGEDNQFGSAHPLLLRDLDGDGLSEIVLPRWNRVYRNRGNFQFEKEEFLAEWTPIWEAGILADVDGDAQADFVSVSKKGALLCWKGGAFDAPPVPAAPTVSDFVLPSAITAGDVEGDGDLDLWVTQYKLSFENGQMPTPYYDANDGYPSYLFLNDGSGNFRDATAEAGLASLRNRRTYSASFVDLDEDGDQDLINVSDYAGLDIHENLGSAQFREATADFVDERHFFGMGHTFGDYNHDGRLDFYVIGMSSTTARRLDDLNLGRDDRPDVHEMRASMGYGNRMYFGTEGKKFAEDAAVAKKVARTGWSWGVSSFDLDLDGDRDIFVANGHRSGKSCQDYCTQFWRHDIYTGDSRINPEVKKLFMTTLGGLNAGEISWNGYEKDFLFVNEAGEEGRFLNAAHLFGAAHSYDGRAVATDDLDGDGRPDLLVSRFWWDGHGFVSEFLAYRNEITTTNHWIGVHLRESGPGRSPHGATVTAKTGDRAQKVWLVSGDSFLSQHAPAALFGIGEATSVDHLEVRWPNGTTQRIDSPEIDRWHSVRATP